MWSSILLTSVLAVLLSAVSVTSTDSGSLQVINAGFMTVTLGLKMLNCATQYNILSDASYALYLACAGQATVDVLNTEANNPYFGINSPINKGHTNSTAIRDFVAEVAYFATLNGNCQTLKNDPAAFFVCCEGIPPQLSAYGNPRDAAVDTAIMTTLANNWLAKLQLCTPIPRLACTNDAVTAFGAVAKNILVPVLFL